MIQGGTPCLYFANDPLPGDVWKLRVEFVQVDSFASDELWTVRGIPIPGRGKSQRVNATTTLRGATLGLLFLGGKHTTVLGHPAVRVKGVGIPTDRRVALVRAVDDRGRSLDPDDPVPMSV